VYTTALGRKLLEFSCKLLEGQPNTMNAAVLKELISRFRRPTDIRGPINYYRQLVLSQIIPEKRKQRNRTVFPIAIC
jgi:hypothetical protein